MGDIVVGRVDISMRGALKWVCDYTDPERAAKKKPYAYPGYDFMDAGSASNELNDGDLLAPALLNSTPSVSAFYRLQQLAPELAGALGEDKPLATLSDDQIAAHVAPVYGVLDADRKIHRGYGLSGTTLSKVLHRKRPHSLCLHDKWVNLAYVGPNAPVPRAKKRPWANYMTLLSQAMAADLRANADEFEELRGAVQGKALTDLRILDILAWSCRGGTKAEPL